MKTVLLVVFLWYSLVYAIAEQNILTDEFINAINNQQSLWKAGKNFNGKITREEIRGLLGLKNQSTPGIKQKFYESSDGIPESFDAREQWPDCSSIKEIADQSACGSCWAVATASSMSDRTCIMTGGKSQPRISAKYIMSCCDNCGHGCQGGIPIYAWEFWASGIPTGGLYNSSVGCQPYPFPTCEHHIPANNSPVCPTTQYEAPQCSKQCDTDEELVLTYGADSATLHTETAILNEIYQYGPIVADLRVYEDYLAYKSGIYQHTTGGYLGGHAVRIIGWGVENGVKYWLVANSWNEDWGDKGLFKIIRGTGECGIEDGCSSGIPILP